MTVPYDDSRLTTVGLFYEAFQGLNSVLRERFNQHTISLTDFEILLRLLRSPHQRLRMTDLAVQTSLTTSGVTRVVDRLEEAGYVAREHCDTDRRGTWAGVTPAGVDALEAVLPGHLEDIDRWLVNLLDPQQLDALISGLRIVRDAVRPGAVAGAEDTGPDAVRKTATGTS